MASNCGHQRVCCSPLRWHEYGGRVTMEWYWHGKTEKLGQKTCHSATLSTNPTWSDLGANSCLCDDGPASIRMSHGTANGHVAFLWRVWVYVWVIFEVLTAACVNIRAFWVVAPCSLFEVDLTFTRLHGAISQKAIMFVGLCGRKWLDGEWHAREFVAHSQRSKKGKGIP
jgi:hypothetical protein